MSDDGESAVVVIALLGSPFSPRYARARALGDVDPLDFSAFNVSISRAGASRWTLTERRSAAVARDATSLAIGRSAMRWTPSGELAIDIDERSAPWGKPVRGRILFSPSARASGPCAIDGRGEHLWWLAAPLGHVEVTLEEPATRFSGTGYLDANAGTSPLEETFARWSWSRASTAQSVRIAYDVTLRDRSEIARGFVVDREGISEHVVPEQVALGRTRFGLPRPLRCPSGTTARLVRTLEDGPFYARSLVECREHGTIIRGVHETISLSRFASSWVKLLLPFRMRREAA